MILIANIGNRDVLYKGVPLKNNNFRRKSEALLKIYELQKDNLSFPILSPYLETFKDKLKRIYLFVTNQEDERYRPSDTLFLGSIIKLWVKKTYNVSVNVVDYVFNPTDYELTYRYFTNYFLQERSVFDRAEKRLISLSGGTPQMNGALYVILSSIYPENNEFYSVEQGNLIHVNHEKTINKIYAKKGSSELLRIYQYQSIVRLLERYSLTSAKSLVFLLKYAHFRRNFNFEEAKNNLAEFKKTIPSAQHKDYDFLDLDDIVTPKNLIKELFWRIEICYKNHNYLFLVSLLFRLEEALLFEIVNYLFKDDYKKDFRDRKETHSEFVAYLENNEEYLWNNLKETTFKGQKLLVDPNDLNRIVLFFIAFYKCKELERKGVYIHQVRYVLDILDKINKYRYDEEGRKEFYGDQLGSKCLGDLRNKSLIAHGFEPVSKEVIEELYNEQLDKFFNNLKAKIENLLGLFLGEKSPKINNIFKTINEKLSVLIKDL